MKVLMITPYVTISSRKEFSRNKTGFGYMVYDIARSVAQIEEVDVLASDVRGRGFQMEGIRFVKRFFYCFFVFLFCCSSPAIILHLLRKYRMSSGAFIRLAYYWLMTGYVQHVIKKENYDIIHLHGCGFGTELWIQVCEKCNKKFIITLHGLNSFSETVKLESAGKQFERDFLKKVVESDIPITVISTGMKHTIEAAYGKNDCKNISVVCNSFSFPPRVSKCVSVRKKYGIPEDAKVLLYVGNISENKNQIQMVEVYNMLPNNLCQNTWVLFCGYNHMHNDSLKSAISQSSNPDHLILCGGVEKDLIQSYYQESNAVVLLSKSEGFGLSLIEGMHFGLPCLMFEDMDAYEDIYDINAVVSVSNRSNQCVVDGVCKLLSAKWNRDVILKCSKRFESSTMAQNYIKVYKL